MTSHPVRDLFEAARQLSAKQQSELVDLLLTRGKVMDAKWEAAWVTEASARFDEAKAGNGGLVDADEAIADGRRRLKRVRVSK